MSVCMYVMYVFNHQNMELSLTQNTNSHQFRKWARERLWKSHTKNKEINNHHHLCTMKFVFFIHLFVNCKAAVKYLENKENCIRSRAHFRNWWEFVFWVKFQQNSKDSGNSDTNWRWQHMPWMCMYAIPLED
jgi:hypothetical protein